MNEIKKIRYGRLGPKVAEALKKRSFEAYYFDGAEEAREKILQLITPDASVGFGGTITMMVGIDLEGKVTGISIISHTETAGLGSVAGDNSAKGQAFRDSFIGLSGSVSTSKDGGEADTITGATITSRAICDGVNAALEFVRRMG